MHILVTAASKHGATDEVADAIAKRFETAGFTVDRVAPADVTTVDPYDAVVVGSAVYILQWMPEAHDFMERFQDELRTKQVWAFSVGMSGVPKHTKQDSHRVGPLLTHVNCRELRTFPGRYKPELLSRAWPAWSRATSAIGRRSKPGRTRLQRSCRADNL